jgi:hypothetical protein
MARYSFLAVALCAVLAVQLAQAIDDDNCRGEAEKILAMYSGSGCAKVINQTIYATSKDDCPNKNYWVDCFGQMQERWTDFYDDCEDAFDDSACLSNLGDDEFERLLKNECYSDRRKQLAKYDGNDKCLYILANATYSDTCPDKTELHDCFKKHETSWTEAVDDCEEMWEDSPCEWLADYGDDEFENWLDGNSAASAATFASAALAAVAVLALLA